ncbi:hemerythrin-like domain-containing protein [Streptosporangium becharense]|uniref:Hemerythrin-like domain-containing protein n=1 Tax=Streptosporangium becharense TaxID=1816182 RepID=A0A7W9MI52_9ACTN|nr:hemerythrin domain-containing protein [Streptosporangium becharense]MBB2913453.1 hemerythrin-like domain-containing protein [Streptosporangium becharense]MBB5821143.1 hemerythrin-like domain-containing protein [Streptosporangium becharense]
MATPETLGFQIAHRSMRGEVRRLADLTAQLADGRQSADPARARAIVEYIAAMCTTIHHHHKTEDEVLWPVIERSAGAEVDLRDLSDDHAELDPLLDTIRSGSEEFLRTSDARRLAVCLTRLADMLDEHIEEEERLLFPIIRKYVSVADWKRVEDVARKGSNVMVELPRIEQYARPDELATLRRLAGPVLTVMFTVLRGGHRRRQRLIFGPLADV